MSKSKIETKFHELCAIYITTPNKQTMNDLVTFTFNNAAFLCRKVDNSYIASDNDICLVLDKYNLPKNLSGYRYLVDVVKLILSTPIHRKLVEDIYKEVSLKYNKTPYAIERCIRHIISKSYIQECFNPVWSRFKTCPTNTKFIYHIVEEVRNNLN